jgi:hypothetical protein
LKLEPHDQRLANHPRLVLGLCVLLAGLPILTVLGLPTRDMALGGLIALVHSLLSTGLLAGAYFGAGVGLAWPIVAAIFRVARPADGLGSVGAGSVAVESVGAARRWAQLALGAALMPWLSHALGVLGLLSGGVGSVVGIGVLIVGGALLAAQAVRFFRASPRVPDLARWPLAGAVALAVLLVAAVNPPGWLWRSEAGGFDALSYHLPLAQEWAQSGARIWPLEHNVYSFLPSYIEASFTHIAAVLGGSLTAGDGVGALACQLLHAIYAVVAAALITRAVTLASVTGGRAGPGPSAAGLTAAQALLATPWVVVTASLAYNEMAMVAMLAGATALALETALTPARRALLCGLLLGVACGFKPTALLIGGPTVGLLLLVATPARAWPKMLLVGALAGVVAFGPPLVRNWIASGNPLFPAGTGVFGWSWPWTAQQVEGFATNHGAQGGLLEKLGRLFELAGPGTVDGQPRGVFHIQWGLLFPVGAASLAIALALGRDGVRRAGLALAGGTCAGLLAWALFTHGQSRFLMPLAVNLCVGLGLATACFLRGPREAADAGPDSGTNAAPPARLPLARRLGVLGAMVVPLVQAATLVSIFVREGGGSPNQLMVAGVAARTGELLAAQRGALSPAQFREALDAAGPEASVNLRLAELGTGVGPATSVYLLGDATPLYFRVPVLYHTVWDASPLGEAIRQSPGAPRAWSESLARRNVGFVLVNFGELSRYWRTYGYDPAVTPATVVAWVGTLGEPVREWAYDEQGLELTWRDIVSQDPRRWSGRVLWRVSPPGPAAPAAPGAPRTVPSAQPSKRPDLVDAGGP